MTIASTENKKIYQGNGVNTTWPIDFPFTNAEQIQVYLTDPSGNTTAEPGLTADFLVDILNEQVLYPGYAAGSEPPIYLQPLPLPEGWKITVCRRLPLTQEVALTNQGAWNPNVIENQLDRITMIQQQQQEEINRSIRLSISDTSDGSDILNAIYSAQSETTASAVNASISAENALASENAASISATNASISETNVAISVANATEAVNQAIDAARLLGTIPVGMIVQFPVETPVPGFLMLNGAHKVSSFDPLLYPDLYAYLGTSQLPDLTNKFPEGAGDNIEGLEVKAWRLPAFGTIAAGEHTHVIATPPDGVGFNLGASAGMNMVGTVTHTASSDANTLTASAGLHSHTLNVPAGNTDTYLAPDAFGVYYAIKAYGVISNEGTADVAKLISDVDALRNDAYTVDNFPANFRNRIINGDMRIDQRNDGWAITPTASTYIFDRWKFSCSQASKFTIQQNSGLVTPPPGFTKYLGLTVASGYTAASNEYFHLSQAIEPINTSDFAWGTEKARFVTLSFWVQSSVVGTHSGSISGFQIYPFTFNISKSNTWTYVTINIPGPIAAGWNNVVTRLFFNLGSGSNFLAARENEGTWISNGAQGVTGSVSIVENAGATFYITGVQLEKGTTATPFEVLPFQTQLQLCQRYCYQIKSGGSSASIATGQVISGTLAIFSVPLPNMYTSPTLYVSNIYVTNGAGTYLATTTRSVSFYSASSAVNSVLLTVGVASGLTTGQASTLYAGYSSAGYMRFDAEL